VDFVEICNVYAGKMVINAPKRIFNSDTICRTYSDLNFGVTFLEHSVYRFKKSGKMSVPALSVHMFKHMSISVSSPTRGSTTD